LKLFNKNP